MFTSTQADAYDAMVTAYPSHWDEEEREEAIDARVDELTESWGDYHPFCFDNFVQYLAEEATEADKASFLNLINKHALEINQLRTNVLLYWHKAARAQAIHEQDHP